MITILLTARFCVTSPISLSAEGNRDPVSFTVCSFNIQTFGPSKAEKPEVMAELAEIIRRHDIVCVQEIRDASGTAVTALLDMVNTEGPGYGLLTGPREGRSSSKEQYAFFYRTDRFELLPDYCVYEGQDQFERPPFTAGFKLLETGFDFVLINVHIKPGDAEREIAALPPVFAASEEYFRDSDIICLGDFNADGDYFDEATLSLYFPQERYRIVIPDTADTTVAENDNTYDRIIITDDLSGNYKGEYGIDLFTDAGVPDREISDHYPVWIRLFSE